MDQSIMKIVIVATVDMSPEEFLDKYNTILIERMNLTLCGQENDKIVLNSEDYDIIRIEEL